MPGGQLGSSSPGDQQLRPREENDMSLIPDLPRRTGIHQGFQQKGEATRQESHTPQGSVFTSGHPCWLQTVSTVVASRTGGHWKEVGGSPDNSQGVRVGKGCEDGKIIDGHSSLLEARSSGGNGQGKTGRGRNKGLGKAQQLETKPRRKQRGREKQAKEDAAAQT